MARFVLLICILGLISGCEKEDKGFGPEVSLTASNIVGAWQLEAQEFSIGGPAIRQPVENGGKYTFELDQIYTYKNTNDDAFNSSGSYTIHQEILSLFRTTDSIPFVHDFFVELGKEKMILSPAGPVICIEGCSDFFKKIN